MDEVKEFDLPVPAALMEGGWPKFDQEAFRKALRRATRPFIIQALSTQILQAMKVKTRTLGWTVAVHGSMTRDVDLLAAPWTDEAVDSVEFVKQMLSVVERTWGGKAFASDVEHKPWGRLAVVIHSTSERLYEDETGAHPYIDLSIIDGRTHGATS